jgi:hypothetical protein
MADNCLAPASPRLPRVEAIEERLLSLEYPLGLVGGDRRYELGLTAREVP